LQKAAQSASIESIELIDENGLVIDGGAIRALDIVNDAGSQQND
jgi:hypothetical protein